MNAASPEIAPVHGRTAADPLTGKRWGAVQEAAKIVALLAGVTDQTPDSNARNFAALVRDCDPWRREVAERSVADLAAIMEPGLATLLAVNARGNDCRAVALALWSEYTQARAALLALLPPTGAMGPRRAA